MRDAEFRHPRLVEVYDAENTWAHDDDFFLSIVNGRRRSRVVDLGCGTGRLAIAMARDGHTVTGVDPAATSLEAARAKSGADAVSWIEGTSSVLPPQTFDAALMTSHVVQFLVSDDEWATVLDDLKRSLVHGATLAFDSRDHRSRAWERWNPVDSRQVIPLPAEDSVTVWTEVTSVDDRSNVVTFTRHFVFSDATELHSDCTIRFRTDEEIRVALDRAGFGVEAIYGGWQRQAVGNGQGELVVVATA